MCLPMCQPRDVTSHEDIAGEEKDDDETKYKSKKPSAEDCKSTALNFNSNGGKGKHCLQERIKHYR